MLKINELMTSGESFTNKTTRTSFYESVEIRTLVKETYLEMNKGLLSEFINKSARGESDSTNNTEKPKFFGKVLIWLKKIWGWIVKVWGKIVEGIRNAAYKIKRRIQHFFSQMKTKSKERKEASSYKKNWEDNKMDEKFRKDFSATKDGWNDNRSMEMHALEKKTYGQIKWSEVDEANYRIEFDLIPSLRRFTNYFQLDKKKRGSILRKILNDLSQFKFVAGQYGAVKLIQPFAVFENRAKRQATNNEPFPEKEFEELQKRLDLMEKNAKALWVILKDIYALIQKTKADDDYTDKEKQGMQQVALIAHNFVYQYQVFGHLGDRSFTEFSAVTKPGEDLPSGHPLLYLQKKNAY